ncbi:MAG: ImmA/IrrE family metallo-endopeptidase [Oscillospiraceae bacterium]|jgi:Zn-dependent peptidase ImmA (M78 family)|nr:ImmA/IrrE family metallo-endopeptidase [Oscillospiraceae bacterium]
MAYEKAFINKETLAFLLSKKSVTSDYLSQKSACKIEQIEKWIDVNNDNLPTLNQARKIADILRVPFAGLYMTVDTITPLMPTKPNVQNRRIMDAENLDDNPVNLAIIDLIQARDFYVETESLLEREVTKFTTQFSINDDALKWASKIRADFNIDLDRQYKAPSARQFYLYLKNRIEEKGIFIQKFIGVDTNTLRAMAIFQSNDEMPIIGVNEKDRPPAKCFSLIHELVHIIKRTSSICNAMHDNAFLQNQEEIFCNAVAGELLAPNTAVATIITNNKYNLTDLADIQKISDKFSVSREVIIRRLLDLSYIQQVDYDTLSKLLNDELVASKEEQKRLRDAGQSSFRIDPAQKAVDKTSMSLSKAIYAGYCEDIFSKYDVAQILSIKTKHVDKYFMEVTKWNN